MRRLILHIGLEKTGSTFLQESFRLNRDALAAQGLLYPESGLSISQHYWLAKAYGFHFERESFDQDAALAARQALGDELQQTDAHTVLISTEHFDFNATAGTCAKLARAFEDWQVTVIAFLRNQLDYAQSLYIEHVKWGGVRSFREFLDDKRKFNFFEKLRVWHESGFELKVLDYDEARSDLLGHFCHTVGIDAALLEHPVTPAAKNPSPPIDFIELVRQLNVGTDRDTARERYLTLLAGLEQVPNTGSIFRKRAWSFPVGSFPIVAAWQRSNRELATLLGENFHSFLGGPLLPRFEHLREQLPPNLGDCLRADPGILGELLAFKIEEPAEDPAADETTPDSGEAE